MTTLNLKVGAGTDDAHESDSNTSFSSSGSVQMTGNGTASTRRNAGFRFANVTIPAGSAVTAASFRLKPINTSNDDFLGALHCEDVADSADFSATADVTDRVRTPLSVAVDSTSFGSSMAELADMPLPVQEVVGRADWVSGNDLTVIWKAGTSTRSCIVRSYDDDSADAAELNLTYTSGFPVIEDVTSTDFTSSSTTHNVSMPATVESGDLLIIIFGCGNVGPSTPSGWSLITSALGNTNGIAVYAKKADGTEDGTTVNVATSFSATASAQVYRIRTGTWGGDATVTNDVKGASSSSSSATAHNPPNLAPGLGSLDFLWLAAAIGSGWTYSAAPANYTRLTTANTAYDMATARRRLTASSEDPGSFTVSGGSWAVATIAIEPASSGASATITGAVAAADMAALPGTVSATRIAAVTGTVATATQTAVAGTVAAQVVAAVTGEVAALTLDAIEGTVLIARAIAGEPATMDMAALPGSIESEATATVTGEVATLTQAAHEGAVLIAISIDGAVALATLDALEGAAATVRIATVTGEAATQELAALAGTVDASLIAAIAGEPATMDLAALAGTVATVRVVSVTGALAEADLAALAASIEAQIPAVVTGEPATMDMAALAGVVDTPLVVAVTGEPATMDMAAIAGTASAVRIVAVTGEVATAELAAHEGVVAIYFEAIIAGEAAAMTAAALAGSVSTSRIATIEGTVAEAVLSALAGAIPHTPAFKRTWGGSARVVRVRGAGGARVHVLRGRQ